MTMTMLIQEHRMDTTTVMKDTKTIVMKKALDMESNKLNAMTRKQIQIQE